MSKLFRITVITTIAVIVYLTLTSLVPQSYKFMVQIWMLAIATTVLLVLIVQAFRKGKFK